MYEWFEKTGDRIGFELLLKMVGTRAVNLKLGHEMTKSAEEKRVLVDPLSYDDFNWEMIQAEVLHRVGKSSDDDESERSDAILNVYKTYKTQKEQKEEKENKNPIKIRKEEKQNKNIDENTVSKDSELEIEIGEVDDWWHQIVSTAKRFSDDDFKLLYPPRTKADLGIRRTRFEEARDTLPARELTDTLYLLRGWDYISVLNACWFRHLLGELWWQRMNALGAWSGTIVRYFTLAKELNTVIKFYPTALVDWSRYVELGTLTGYRQPPFPGFDHFAEAGKLAHGGEDPHWFPVSWNDVVANALEYVPEENEDQKSFSEYVTSLEWATSGASSEGRLEVQLDGGKVKKVKARKNTIAYVTDLDQLARKAFNNDAQVNVSIVKSELGKVRIAVAGDIESYLQTAWLFTFVNGGYKQWPGSTIEEDVSAQTERMIEMLHAVSESYGLPYDYAAFDHQPTLDEMVTILRFIFTRCESVVRPDLLPQFRQVRERVLNGFLNATLSSTEGDAKQEVKVTGGLMSGHRATSVIGNAWNTCLTWLVNKVQTSLGNAPLKNWIRGDDSALVSKDWQKLSVANESYATFGAVAGVGKFSIRYQALEFLRVWYNERCWGYPARAIPGLTQRKPWSSSPWSEDMVIKALHEVTSTLQRRGCDVQHAWDVIADRWCRLHNLPRAVLAVPTQLGGFGIEAWDGLVLLSEHVPRVDRPPIQVRNLSERAIQRTLQRAIRLKIPMSTANAITATQHALASALRGDDVATIAREYRESWKLALKQVTIREVTTSRHAGRPIKYRNSIAAELARATADPGGYQRLKTTLKKRAILFGSGRKWLKEVSDAKELLRFSDSELSLKQWIKCELPDLWRLMEPFQRKTHFNEALDWVMGDIPTSPSVLHPALGSLVKYATAATLSFRQLSKDRRLIALMAVSNVYNEALFSSQLSRRIYMW